MSTSYPADFNVASPDQFSNLRIEAIRAWRPNAACIAAGDEHADRAVRSYAAAGLSDVAIAGRLRLFAADLEPLDVGRYDAGVAVARHGAIVGAPARQIVAWLAYLACEIPCWAPDDPQEIASLARSAIAEIDR